MRKMCKASAKILGSPGIVGIWTRHSSCKATACGNSKFDLKGLPWNSIKGDHQVDWVDQAKVATVATIVMIDGLLLRQFFLFSRQLPKFYCLCDPSSCWFGVLMKKISFSMERNIHQWEIKMQLLSGEENIFQWFQSFLKRLKRL